MQHKETTTRTKLLTKTI